MDARPVGEINAKTLICWFHIEDIIFIEMMIAPKYGQGIIGNKCLGNFAQQVYIFPKEVSQEVDGSDAPSGGCKVEKFAQLCVIIAVIA